MGTVEEMMSFILGQATNYSGGSCDHHPSELSLLNFLSGIAQRNHVSNCCTGTEKQIV